MNTTLLSLINIATRGGLFVSAKQAAFMLREGNQRVFAETYTFGERGGCRRVVEYTVALDEIGVVSIAKSGAKTETMFIRGEINVYAENAAAKAQRTISMYQDEVRILTNYLAQKKEELATLQTSNNVCRGELANPDVPKSTRLSVEQMLVVAEEKIQEEIVDVENRLAVARAELSKRTSQTP